MLKQPNTMQLEALEARQLLATVVGSGEEVGSDISFQGNTYDQILMTGASVSVSADAGQIVRVSAVDSNDDIVQYEFSGSGTMSISLDDFEAAALPVNYEQDVEYVKGTASITIEGSDSSTNVSVSTVGEVTSPVFSTLDNGADLDGVADIKSITIIADSSNPSGSNFGGIRTANARYEGNSGIVGISGTNVAVQGPVIVGDIDASDTGVPSLVFGSNSQFGTVKVAGGDLAQTNGQDIENDAASFESVNFIAGTTSDNVTQAADIFGGAWVVAGPTSETLDNASEILITDLTQAEIDTLFSGKTFTGDVLVTGNLATQNNISVKEFRGNVTFDGELDGAITVIGDITGNLTLLGVDHAIGSTITIGGSLGGDFVTGAAAELPAQPLGGSFFAPASAGIVINGDFSGTLTAQSIGGVEINGDMSGLISTDSTNNGTYDAGEGGIGDVKVTGDLTGLFEGIDGIGDITIVGDIQNNSGTESVFYTSSNTGGDAYLANIGTLTVTGDVNIDDGGSLVNINVNGNFGDIALNGGGISVGLIQTGGTLGATSTGSITVTGGTTAGVALLGVTAAEGSIGAITVTGDGTIGTTFTLDSTANDGIVATTGDIGDITISGFDTITLADDIDATAGDIGNLSFDSNADVNHGTVITQTGSITAGGDLASLSYNSDATTITATTGEITITGTAGDITITGDATVNEDFTAASMGAFKVDGDATFAADHGIEVTGAATSFEATGDMVSTATNEATIQVGSIGDITIGGGLDMSASAVTSIEADDGTSALDSIGDISIGGLTLGGDDVVDISASSIGNITISAALTATGESLVTDLSVEAIPHAVSTDDAGETVETDGSDLGNYSIGDITIETTNTIGIASTSLFDSSSDNNNVFHAMGAIGDITLSGGGSVSLQTSLFADPAGNFFGPADGAVFYASGAGNGDYNAVNSKSITYWDGDTDTAETYSDLSGGTVTIGNVYINTASADAATDSDTIHAIQGDAITTAWSGLNIFAGVTAGHFAMNNALDDVGGHSTRFHPTELMVAQDADLSGTIGTITVMNKVQQLTVPGAVGTDIVDNSWPFSGPRPESTSDFYSGIVAATSVGAVNGASYTADASGEWIEIGAHLGGAANTLNPDEYIVYIA